MTIDRIRHPRARSRARFTLLALIALAASPLATAADSRVAAGADVGSQAQRGYLGIELPLSGQLHDGLVQRIQLDWERYGYAGGAVDVTAPAAGYSLGYQSQGAAGWWGGYLGLQYRRPDRSAPRPDAEDEDGWRVGFHFDGELALTPNWTVSGRLDTYPASKGYRAGGRLMKKVGAGLSAGPELVLESDHEHSAQQLGLVLQGFEPVPGLETAVKVGAQRDDDGETGPYVGIEFSRHF